MLSQHELEARYAGAVSAAAACFVYADCVSDAVAHFDLARGCDRLVDIVGGRGLRVADVHAAAAEVHASGGRLLVDTTVPSHFGCLPFDLGADISLEALDRIAAGKLARKVIAIAFRNDRALSHGSFALYETPDAFVADSSACGSGVATKHELAGEDLAAIEDGLGTVAERMQRHFDHARALAEYLSCCDSLISGGRVAVSYPGLTSHPDHDLATRVLVHGFGPAVDFELPDAWGVAAGEFIRCCRLNGRSQPAGGFNTRLHARDGSDGRAVRIFAGLDNPLEIADDLDQAMRWFRNPPAP